MSREVRDLDKDVTATLAPFAGSFNPSQDPATACSVLINHLCMRRNKRCLLSYHRVRTDKLEEMCWSGKDVLEEGVRQSTGDTSAAGSRAEDSNQSSLGPEEEEYFRQYGDLLSTYKGQWTDIDLTGSLEPPQDLFIDVRVLKDAGEVQTEYGYVRKTGLEHGMGHQNTMLTKCIIRAITLTKNSQFYVKQGDVERLIAQGYLQKLR